MKSKSNSGADRAGVWLTHARAVMENAGKGAFGSLETQLLLAHVLQKPRAWLIAHPEAPLQPDQAAQLDDLLARLINGEPLPYLLGRWEFYGLRFLVTPAVLIPRPETELLVDRALEILRRSGSRRAADVGTGSGCIAVSMAHNLPGLRMLAVDRSWDALHVASQNAADHGVVEWVTFWQGDLLTASGGPLDLVCANLPYIPQKALKGLPVARYEPLGALDGGADGLDLIRALLADAPRWLAPGGHLLLEMQFDQGEAITRLAQACLPGAQVAIHKDLADLPRLVEITTGA